MTGVVLLASGTAESALPASISALHTVTCFFSESGIAALRFLNKGLAEPRLPARILAD